MSGIYVGSFNPILTTIITGERTHPLRWMPQRVETSSQLSSGQVASYPKWVIYIIIMNREQHKLQSRK